MIFQEVQTEVCTMGSAYTGKCVYSEVCILGTQKHLRRIVCVHGIVYKLNTKLHGNAYTPKCV